MNIEYVDVVIVGAGLSGISAAYHLQDRCPSRSYALLEARADLGGTWDLFRYPGIRSDSDMYTLGYRFRPWKQAKSIADGPAILDYIRETAQEYGIADRIRYQHRVVGAAWSSERGEWTLDIEKGPARERIQLRCSFLHMCSGYYRYEAGYTPRFEGAEAFGGRIVHPQQWPEDLDYAGKQVVVIGSGATAVTLVPAMAGSAAHVTMLQRSPSYVMSLPAKDRIANVLRALLPSAIAYPLARWKNILLSMLMYRLARSRPQWIKTMLRKGLHKATGSERFDPHFTPSYQPWDQRLCLVPDNDLFEALKSGQASIVTDHIDRFVPEGIRLRSGRTLKADIIVTATGLELQLFGGMACSIDGAPVQFAERLSYKGMMLSDIPNFAYTVGYTNASWTLKADLVSEYVCRLLNHLEARGARYCVPRNHDPAMPREPLLDFSSGYVQRALARLPQQGSEVPWKLHQNYLRDLIGLRFGDVEDGVMEFITGRAALVAEPARRQGGKPPLDQAA